jgi:hypothetical protein
MISREGAPLLFPEANVLFPSGRLPKRATHVVEVSSHIRPESIEITRDIAMSSKAVKKKVPAKKAVTKSVKKTAIKRTPAKTEMYASLVCSLQFAESSDHCQYGKLLSTCLQRVG